MAARFIQLMCWAISACLAVEQACCEGCCSSLHADPLHGALQRKVRCVTYLLILSPQVHLDLTVAAAQCAAVGSSVA
jgi:hypothetical protein